MTKRPVRTQGLVRLRRPTVTTEYILLECGNAAARRPYRTDIDDLRREMSSRDAIVAVELAELAQAWFEFRSGQRGDEELSIAPRLSSCSDYRITDVFTNDRHFFRNSGIRDAVLCGVGRPRTGAVRLAHTRMQNPPHLRLLQMLVHKLHGHRAFADGGGDALDEPARTSPAAKTPGRLVSEKVGVPFAGPVPRLLDGGAGLHELLGVALDFRREPIGSRHGADEAEEGGTLERAALAGLRVDPFDFAQGIVAIEPANFGIAFDHDVVGLLDAVDEIARHVFAEIVAADHEMHLGRDRREKDGGLAGGVAAADDHDLRIAAQVGFHRPGGVIDAAALEADRSLRC